jgi:luciferase family oxidoreductase group 1
VAAAMGLPYAFASHFAPTYFNEAIRIYRENFQPSTSLQKPYVMACVNVVAADTDAEADYLATSVQQFFMGVVTGKRSLLQPPVQSMNDIWNIYEEEAVKQMLAYSFIGGPEKLKQEVSTFIEKTQIDEVMATSHIFEHKARLHSYNVFANIINEVNNNALAVSYNSL